MKTPISRAHRAQIGAKERILLKAQGVEDGVEDGAAEAVVILLALLGSLLPRPLLFAGRIALEAEDRTKPTASTSHKRSLRRSAWRRRLEEVRRCTLL